MNSDESCIAAPKVQERRNGSKLLLSRRLAAVFPNTADALHLGSVRSKFSIGLKIIRESCSTILVNKVAI